MELSVFPVFIIKLTIYFQTFFYSLSCGLSYAFITSIFWQIWSNIWLLPFIALYFPFSDVKIMVKIKKISSSYLIYKDG